MERKLLLYSIATLLLVSLVQTSLAADDVPATGHCAKLHQKYNPEKCFLFVRNKTRQVVIKSTDRPPSRATAVLLATGLRHRYGYDVTTEIDNRDSCRLAKQIATLREDSSNDRILIHVDADSEGPEENCSVLRELCNAQQDTCNVAGVRLESVGFAVSLNVLWHVRITKEAKTRIECAETNFWEFYNFHKNPMPLMCGFPIKSGQPYIPLLVPTDIKSIKEEKLNRVIKYLPFFERKNVDRDQLTSEIRNNNFSFHFIDFDLWRKSDLAQVVEDSPQVASQPAISLRLADVKVFRQYAPQILNALSSFKPQPDHLRQILEIQTSTNQILHNCGYSYEESACSWANNHSEEIESWANDYLARWTIYFLECNHTSNTYNYVTLIRTSILKWISDTFPFKYAIKRIIIDCHDRNCVNAFLDILSRDLLMINATGVVAPGNGATEEAQKKAIAEEIPVIYYDVIPTRVAAITSTGSLQRLAIATRHFFTQQGWRRVAVISENTLIAEDLCKELTKGDFIFREKQIETTNKESVRRTLLELKKEKARIFYLNGDAKFNVLVACEAVNMSMMPDQGYAWIAREWYWDAEWYLGCEKPIPLYTVSYSWTGWTGRNMSVVEDVLGDRNVQLQDMLKRYWKQQAWTPSAAPLADAFVMMTKALNAMHQKYPDRRFDLHSVGTSSLFAEELRNNKAIKGVTQALHQKNFTLKDPFIFVSSWNKSNVELLAVWKAFGEDLIEQKIFKRPYQDTTPPSDGQSRCTMLQIGDQFMPFCLDPIIITLIVIAIIVIVTVTVIVRIRKKQLEERDKVIERLLLQLRTTADNGRLNLPMRQVDRSAIKLYEELGSGHFGLVSSGTIHDPHREPEVVAIKALRKDPSQAEEIEFLQEAKALASLSHQHIVRLVGVCAGDGQPPLLLMEYAFFGDLLHYLRTRRYLLAGVFGENGKMQHWDRAEARHISARQLTRLAREAATALAYLEKRRLVHRDIRAANCLIDASRTLKLADFGLARWLNKHEQSEWPEFQDSDKYFLQRPTAFPARWTAPESIIHGEFSYASDVWALGVLMLEIVTLGAPPYGDWTDAKVIQYVQKGARPPVPRDVNMKTRQVTDMCWKTDPSLRASADRVRDDLSMYPEALQPAYREPDYTDFPNSQADSGFGDRELNTDWPLPKDPCISTL